MADADRNVWAASTLRTLADTVPEPTPLRPLALPFAPDLPVLVKDESALPTGSLKFRIVRDLLADAVAAGEITAGTPVVAGTSGAVAVAGARLATLIGAPFTAVVPDRTPRPLLDRIEASGGRWQRAQGPPAALQQEAAEVAQRSAGHLLDHFAHAERAAGAGGPTLADELLTQLDGLGRSPAAWIVAGVGTGATTSALGRRLRRDGLPTRLAAVDPENSAYFPAWASGARDYGTGMPSRIPGIGRPRVEPGFRPGLLDLVVPVPDAASLAAATWLNDAGFDVGPATGAVLWGACEVIARAEPGGCDDGVVLVAGDVAAPYRRTHLDPGWALEHGMDGREHRERLEEFLRTGAWNPPR